MNAARLIAMGTLCCLFLADGAKAPACSVPVFRYALNYWPADSYELQAQAQAAKLPTDVSINLDLKPSDAAEARLLLEDRQVWSGKLSPEVLTTMLDSPVRREIVQHILHGDSVVWILVESGDAAEDNAAARTLTERLRYLESIAVVPELRPDDPTNRIGPGPALTIKHAVVRLSRKDPKEAFTLAMLEQVVSLTNSPTAYPVFGRGRVLISLPQEKLTEDNIDEVCQFLTSACSCEVKDKRMGWDLLLPCDWDEELARAEQQRLNGPAPSQPAESSPGQSELKAETVTFRPQLPGDQSASAAESSSTSAPSSPPWRMRNLAIAGISVILASIVAWLSVRSRV